MDNFGTGNVSYREEKVTIANQEFTRKVYLSSKGEVVGSELSFYNSPKRKRTWTESPVQLAFSTITACALAFLAMSLVIY